MMKEDELLDFLPAARKCLVVVEGKKDRFALEELGFPMIFVLNEDGKSLYEKIEEIEGIAGRKRVCILTDFDKKGRQLYLLLKRELGAKRVKMDNSFRGVLLKSHISHIEGLASFVKNMEMGKSY